MVSSITWFSVDVLLYAIALPLVLRAMWVRFSAEQGRRHDLVYRPPVTGNDFQVAVLVPLMHPDDELALHDLLTCFQAQSYDLNQVNLVLLVSSHAYMTPEHFNLPAYVNWLDVPTSASQSQQSLLQWGINRILATHPPHLFVLLDSHDLVKPDFLSHTVSAAYQYDVYQGYIAHRDFGEGLLSRSLGLLTRLSSRVQSVGRFHGSLGLLFRESGLAFKANVVERFPIQHQEGIGYAPWSITLNQAGLKIHWVPNIIVYQRYYPDLFEHVERQLHASMRVFFSLARQFLRLARPQELEQRFATLPHNPILNLVGFVALAIFTQQNQSLPTVLGSPAVWWTFVSLQALLWFTTLGVARVKPSEWLTSTLVVLGAVLFQLMATPIALVKWLLKQVNLSLFRKTGRVEIQSKPPMSSRLKQMDEVVAVTPPPLPKPQSAPLKRPPDLQTIETDVPLVLAFGSQKIVADLHVDLRTHAHELRYALQLTYKTQQFETQHYARLEDAYQELCETLARFQIEPKTCGNCVHWQVCEGDDTTLALPKKGVCGRSNHDAQAFEEATLNVLSPPCEAHSTQAHSLGV